MAIPVGLSSPKHQERVFFRVADVCIALNFVLDPFIYVLLRGQCGRSCWCRACNPSRCCWPCRKINRQETSLASQLAKDDAKLAGKIPSSSSCWVFLFMVIIYYLSRLISRRPRTNNGRPGSKLRSAQDTTCRRRPGFIRRQCQRTSGLNNYGFKLHCLIVLFLMQKNNRSLMIFNHLKLNLCITLSLVFFCKIVKTKKNYIVYKQMVANRSTQCPRSTHENQQHSRK